MPRYQSSPDPEICQHPNQRPGPDERSGGRMRRTAVCADCSESWAGPWESLPEPAPRRRRGRR